MNDKILDQIIKDSLTEEEAAYYDQLDEQNLVDKVSMLYKGKHNWISIIQTSVMVGTFIVSVYFIFKFYNETEVISMLKWGCTSILLLIVGCMIKIYLNNIIVEKTIRRDIKRLALQLSQLIKELKSNG